MNAHVMQENTNTVKINLTHINTSKHSGQTQ